MFIFSTTLLHLTDSWRKIVNLVLSGYNYVVVAGTQVDQHKIALYESHWKENQQRSPGSSPKW